jgi:hypothetical protein
VWGHGVLLICTVYSVLYSEIALSRKQFGIGHMYIYIFLFRMTDTVTSRNIDLSSWDTLYNVKVFRIVNFYCREMAIYFYFLIFSNTKLRHLRRSMENAESLLNMTNEDDAENTEPSNFVLRSEKMSLVLVCTLQGHGFYPIWSCLCRDRQANADSITQVSLAAYATKLPQYAIPYSRGMLTYSMWGKKFSFKFQFNMDIRRKILIYLISNQNIYSTDMTLVLCVIIRLWKGMLCLLVLLVDSSWSGSFYYPHYNSILKYTFIIIIVTTTVIRKANNNNNNNFKIFNHSMKGS